MKKLTLFLLSFFSILNIYSQTLDDENKYALLPNNYNFFIDSPSVSWASYCGDYYSFHNCSIDTFKNIYDYLVQKKDHGRIKSYLTRFYTDEIPRKNKTDYYFEVDKKYHDHLGHIALQLDPDKTFQFNEILFVENHKLKCYLMALAPNYIGFDSSSSSSLFYTHLVKSFCSLNSNHDYQPKNTDEIVPIETRHFNFAIDNPVFSHIKTMYGMNLSSILWYDLSKGDNEVIDLDSNKVIPPNNVWDYCDQDSIKIPSYDSVGNLNGYIMKPAFRPTLMRNIFSFMGIYEDWSYDITQNIFLCKIKEADLYISKDDAHDVYDTAKKRFKIIFK